MAAWWSTSRACGACRWTGGVRRSHAEGWLDVARLRHCDGGRRARDPGRRRRSTGVCGLPLGGGIGHLTAQHGLTCDNLVGAELVTPDGSFVRASADENPELLWALAGGRRQLRRRDAPRFRLHPLQSVIGGGSPPRAGRGMRFAPSVTSSPARPRRRVARAVLLLEESLEPALVVFPCVTGSENDHPLLETLRDTRGSWRTGSPGACVHRAAVLVRLRLRRRAAVLEGPFRAWSCPTSWSTSSSERISALGRPPGGILFESLHGAPRRCARRAIGYRRRVQRQRDSGLAKIRARRPAHRVVTQTPRPRSSRGRQGGATPTTLQADEPIERVRAMFAETLRPAASAEAALRPGQRPVPQPEHPRGE